MNLNNIITSAIISLIVSFVTFIFGLKAGKNQADRAILKEQYRSLYTHFSKLFESLSSEKPLRWHNFKKIQSIDSIRYLPLVKEMIDDGTIIEVNKKMAIKMEKLETDILVLTAKQYNYYHRIESIILKSTKRLIGRELIQEYGSYRTTKDTIGKSYIPIPYGVFFQRLRIAKQKSDWGIMKN